MYNYYGGGSGGLSKSLPQILGLIVLVVTLLFLLVNFGYMRPCDLPGFEKLYYGVRGYPHIAIVSGADGTGNPELLRNIIIERTHQFPVELSVSNLLGHGALDSYDLVIVEHAKTMDSSALVSFSDYVRKGGKLVWIGDAGSKLTDNDYLCKKVSFSFLPAVEQMVPTYDNGSPVVDDNGQAVLKKQKVCGDWTTPYSPDVPSELHAGLCAHDFTGLVLNFIKENESYYKQATSGPVTLCDDKSIAQNPYQVKNAESILNCIKLIKEKTGLNINEIVADNVSEYCDFGVNYWDRGASKSSTDKIIPPINFGSSVLGADYVGQLNNNTGTNLFLSPVVNHLLIEGYESNVDASTWFGVANFTIVDTTGFEYRTMPIMNLKLGKGNNSVTYPAIFVSNPVGPSFGNNGLVVYYAFPIEKLVAQGGGGNLINNLLEFTLCLK